MILYKGVGGTKILRATKIILLGIFGGFDYIIPLVHKWVAWFQKMNFLALKLLVLEPNKIVIPGLKIVNPFGTPFSDMVSHF